MSRCRACLLSGVLLVAPLLLSACHHRAPPTHPATRPPTTASPTPARPSEAPPAAGPRVDEIALCALDPSSPRGLGLVRAVHVQGTADTLGVVDGRRVPLEEASRGGTLREAEWYRAHEPFVLEMGTARLRYDIYGTGRIIDPTDLAYLGEADGLPVFAAASEVSAVAGLLRQALARDPHLSAVLASSPRIRQVVGGLQVLYVPLRRTRCVFQGLLRRSGS